MHLVATYAEQIFLTEPICMKHSTSVCPLKIAKTQPGNSSHRSTARAYNQLRDFVQFCQEVNYEPRKTKPWHKSSRPPPWHQSINQPPKGIASSWHKTKFDFSEGYLNSLLLLYYLLRDSRGGMAFHDEEKGQEFGTVAK